MLVALLSQVTAKDPNTGGLINIRAVIQEKYEEYKKNFLVRQVCRGSYQDNSSFLTYLEIA
jgi:hypothetical protein